MKARRKGSLSWWILSALEKTVDGYVAFDDFIHNPLLVGRDLKKSELSRAINRLREKGLIEEAKLGEDVIFKLTDSGRNLTFGYDENLKSWDGKWRVVIWDIPEQKRLIRDLFRRNLKKWGFKQIQKSVWFTKKDIYQKLINYVKELGLEKWVVVIETSRISNDSIIINDR